MDENIQRLQHTYTTTGDTAIGCSLISALIRSHYFDARIRQHTASHTRYAEDSDYETFYAAWSPVGDSVVIVRVVREFTAPVPPPRAQLREHLSPEELWDYERAWQGYRDQDRGTIVAFMHVFTPKEALGFFEARHFSVFTSLQTILNWFGQQLDRLAAAQARHNLPGSEWISIIDRFSEDIDFADELEPLMEEPSIENEFGGRCEDYPACGHDICPRYFTTGEQAEMVCVCGRSLPITSRYSICERCLKEEDGEEYGWEPYDEEADDEELYEDEWA